MATVEVHLNLMRKMQFWRELISRHRILVLGQLVSILITATGIFTQIINQNYGISLPAFQNVGNYFLLSVSMVVWLFKSADRFKLSVPWYKYLLIALADVEGNYLVVLAYKYTSISR